MYSLPFFLGLYTEIVFIQCLAKWVYMFCNRTHHKKHRKKRQMAAEFEELMDVITIAFSCLPKTFLQQKFQVRMEGRETFN